MTKKKAKVLPVSERTKFLNEVLVSFRFVAIEKWTLNQFDGWKIIRAPAKNLEELFSNTFESAVLVTIPSDLAHFHIVAGAELAKEALEDLRKQLESELSISIGYLATPTLAGWT